jgi:Thymidine kinase
VNDVPQFVGGLSSPSPSLVGRQPSQLASPTTNGGTSEVNKGYPDNKVTIVTDFASNYTPAMTLIVGPMYAGKTTELLKRVRVAEIHDREFAVVKKSGDNRYSNT